jgi:hypothetical protein
MIGFLVALSYGDLGRFNSEAYQLMQLIAMGPFL